jgi:EAL domain-containing protein (putative c-di-GMP-specific phosphodiesterase class I)
LEYEEQIDMLRLIGCAEMQGNYFSKPLPARDFSHLLAGPPAAVDVSVA